ncbi:MAG: hypothetical protein JRI95_13100 [Deltaproteobacteria bacterium]|nr:hypothetical protein [Deltaproteobacteria bacterium]
MSNFREFSSSDEVERPVRNIDLDAPDGMRQELIDLFFHLAEHNSPPLNEGTMHRIVCQSLGEKASGQPFIEVIQEHGIGFTTQIPIYHSDGTYLAKVKSNRVYPTEAGKKVNIEIRDTPGKFICSLENKVMFELSHGVGESFKADAELYAPDGYFIKCSDAPKPELFVLTGNGIKVGEVTMFGNVFQNVSVGIWLRKDGSCAIGVG